MSIYAVGQYVRAKVRITEGPDDWGPLRLLANKGDVLVIRKIPESVRFHELHVSHESVTDQSFGVNCNEIEAV